MSTPEYVHEGSAVAGLRLQAWKEQYYKAFFSSDAGEVYAEAAGRLRPLSASGAGKLKKSGLLDKPTHPIIIDLETEMQKLAFINIEGTPPASLAAFKEAVLRATAGAPKVHRLVKHIISEFDKAFKNVTNETNLGREKTTEEIVTRLQKEILKLHEDLTKKEEQGLVLLKANKDFKEANAQYCEEVMVLQRHVNEIHDQLQKVCGRLFLDAPLECTPRHSQEKKPFSPFSIYTQHTAVHFVNGLKRLCAEIEHLRYTKHMISEELSRLYTYSNNQQHDISVHLAKGKELSSLVADLKETVKDLKGTNNTLLAEKQLLETEANSARISATEAYTSNLQKTVLEMELNHAKDLLHTFLERRDVKHQKEQTVKEFPGRGTGDDTPQYLKTTLQHVKNKNFGRSSILQYLKEIWHEHSNGIGSLENALTSYAARQKQPVEFAYNLVEGCERQRLNNTECDLFLRITRGEVSEKLYYAADRAITTVKQEADRIEKDLRSKGRSTTQGRIPFDTVVKILRTTLQLPQSSLSRTVYALQMDRISEDIDIEITSYPKFCDAIKRAVVISSYTAWAALSSCVLSTVAAEKDKILSFHNLSKVVSENAPSLLPLKPQDPDEEVPLMPFLENLLTTRYIEYRVKKNAK